MTEILFNSNWIDKSQAVDESKAEVIEPIEPEAKPKRKTAKTNKAKTKAKALPRAKKVKVVESDDNEPSEIKAPIVKEIELTNEITPAKEEQVMSLKDMKMTYEPVNNKEIHELLQQHAPKREKLFDFNKKKAANYSQIGYLAGFGLLVSFLL